MTTNELSIQRLKNLSSEELSDVLAIVSSEIRPVVQAYDNYYYSDELKTYNKKLYQLELDDYTIHRLPRDKNFTFEQIRQLVTDKITNTINQLLEEKQSIEQGFKQEILQLRQSLTKEDFHAFLPYADKKIRESCPPPEPSKFRKILPKIIAYILLVLLRGFITYGFITYGFFNDVFIFLDDFIKTTVWFLTTLTDGVSGFFTFLAYFLIAYPLLILLVNALLFMVELFIPNRYEHSLKKKITQEAKDCAERRYQSDLSNLTKCSGLSLSQFVEREEWHHFYSINFSHQRVNFLTRRPKEIEDSIEHYKAIQSDFIEALETLIRLDERYNEELTIYHHRIENHQSMEQLLPDRYRNLESISELYQLFSEGRADNWKEAVNLLHDEYYKRSLIDNIKSVHGSIGNLTYKLEKVGIELREKLEHAMLETSSANDAILSHHVEQEQLLHHQTQLLIDHNALQNQQAQMTALMLLDQITR